VWREFAEAAKNQFLGLLVSRSDRGMVLLFAVNGGARIVAHDNRAGFEHDADQAGK
jgi:hypothetical protein